MQKSVPVEALNEAIGLWMVSSCSVQLGPIELGNGSPQLRGELSAPVRGDVSGKAEAGQPVIEEGMGTCLGTGVSQWDCVWPSGEPIYHSEKVSVSL